MLRSAHEAARALILCSLRHWVNLGVDGFRFDLASALARAARGRVQTEEAAVISEITALAMELDFRTVAEAWDIGVYLLGRSYPGWLWRQWNGRYRDGVRAFIRGDAGKMAALMRRLYGSDDLFSDGPGDVYRLYQSINFITAHDGFCLYDLVAYSHKHNAANGHDNTDGSDNNISWNCGWEGDACAPAEVLALRRQQVKNFFCLLMLSNGTPMFCADDEFLNTQGGNNNPYNQDNETTWLDWSLLEKNRDRVSLLSAHDRVSEKPAVARTQPLLTRGRALVWCERAGRFRFRVAHSGLLSARHDRPLRDDQCVLGASSVPGSGR